MAIYLDNSATTKPCKAAADTALKLINDEYGNPSSLHFMGFEADRILGSARQTVADSLKVEPSCIYFTPSGTAANNTAVFGAAKALRRRGNRIVTTAIEHPSVARCIDALEAEGFSLTVMPFRTTAENLARYACHKLTEAGLPVSRLDMYETPLNCASYVPQDLL